MRRVVEERSNRVSIRTGKNRIGYLASSKPKSLVGSFGRNVDIAPLKLVREFFSRSRACLERSSSAARSLSAAANFGSFVPVALDRAFIAAVLPSILILRL